MWFLTEDSEDSEDSLYLQQLAVFTRSLMSEDSEDSVFTVFTKKKLVKTANC
jgi:hypothetical protein